MKEKFVLCLVELPHNMVIFLQILTLHRSPLSMYGMSFVVSKPHLTCILHLSLTRHRQYHVIINHVIRRFDWIRICFDTVHSQGFSQKSTTNHITCQWGRDMELFFCDSKVLSAFVSVVAMIYARWFYIRLHSINIPQQSGYFDMAKVLNIHSTVRQHSCMQ